MVSFINIVLLILIFFVGIVSSVTDFKRGKIYNKIILTVLVIGTPFVFFKYGYFNNYFLKEYLINIAITIIFSILFYAFRIWAAGDAKLMDLMVYLIPYDYYRYINQKFFPGIYLFAIIFSLAYVYVVLESIILSFVKPALLKQKLTNNNISGNTIIKFFIRFLTGSSIGNLFFNILLRIGGEYYLNNRYVFSLIIFFLLSAFYSALKDNMKAYYIIFAFSISVNVMFSIYNGQRLRDIFSYSLMSVFIMAIIMIIRFFTETYNYKKVLASEVKAGMVISYESVITLLGTNKNGIVIFTDETTKSRISEEDARAISIWGEKNPEIYLKIVRLMPFSIFIFIGIIVFIFMGVLI
ncbi:prepilin peptidase [Sporanaerobacter sp. PP17-6a]|uniref:prepilin peptidase n=1 Tax=Sporanaerobacter sp. PP17-6a TaxID=1891289 RepID=UPI00089FAC55|nr:prepilin peptidase [Sporanaerobacter sp. PP17-6a]SCL81221.1 Flp pilus assembly protein, protease CpaA [Sporanaerobacter sp. PP17-6a]